MFTMLCLVGEDFTGGGPDVCSALEESTEGAFDESIRHAITKMSHIHFVTNEPACRRVLQMGEDPARVHEVETDFHDTVDAIEAERALAYSAQWAAPATPVDEQTCEACDLRTNCDSYPKGAKLRAEAL